MKDTAHSVLHAPVKDYCRDERYRILTFSIPENLSIEPLTASTIRGLAHLPSDILDYISLYLHPVDRICFALCSKHLLHGIFNRPLAPPRGQIWGQESVDPREPRVAILLDPSLLSQPESPDESTDETRSSPSLSPSQHPTPNRVWLFPFSCPHSSPPCHSCYSVRGTARTLTVQLLRGYSVLPRSHYGYCTSCRLIRPATPSFWLAQFEQSSDSAELRRLLRRAGYQHSYTYLRLGINKPTWGAVSLRERLQAILQCWKEQSALLPGPVSPETAKGNARAITSPKLVHTSSIGVVFCPSCRLQSLRLRCSRNCMTNWPSVGICDCWEQLERSEACTIKPSHVTASGPWSPILVPVIQLAASRW